MHQASTKHLVRDISISVVCSGAITSTLPTGGGLVAVTFILGTSQEG